VRPTRKTFVLLAALATIALAVAVGALGFSHGLWAWNHPDRARYPVWGLDVSHHQGRIVWELVAKDGRLRFAYLKATEGADFKDPQFERNWRLARKNGLRVGAYHFFTFCVPPEEQARHFLAVVPHDPQALPPAIDLELGGNCKRIPDRAELQEALATWAGLVEAELGKRPLVYVTEDSWRVFLRGDLVENPLWFRSLLGEPPSDAATWILWQFHNRGKIPGVRGFVDLDVYRAGAEEFDRL
jgi:lysozyme